MRVSDHRLKRAVGPILRKFDWKVSTHCKPARARISRVRLCDILRVYFIGEFEIELLYLLK